MQDELGLGWYDYGARMYDPSIARWNGVDALAETYISWSPYNYVLGNPANMIDPNGLFVTFGSQTAEDDYEEHKKSLAERKKGAQEALELENLSDEQRELFEGVIDAVDASVREIKTLENDKEQEYHITDGSRSVTNYDWDNDRVTVSYSRPGHLSHELKHAHQFYEGKVSFDRSNVPGLLNDLYDEAEAFIRLFYINPRYTDRLERVRNYPRWIEEEGEVYHGQNFSGHDLDVGRRASTIIFVHRLMLSPADREKYGGMTAAEFIIQYFNKKYPERENKIHPRFE